MKFDEYMELALRTANLGADSRTGLMINGALGLCGESGEVADAIKKTVFQGHPLVREKVAEELGDVLWYVSLVAYAIGYNLEEIAERNIAKLEMRYPKGRFDAEDSIRRVDQKSRQGVDDDDSRPPSWAGSGFAEGHEDDLQGGKSVRGVGEGKKS